MRDLEIARYEADSANRAKSEFLANMSHELRTPLNAVIGFSQILRDASFGPLAPRYRDYANDILSSGFHLLAVVNDILDLAKIEAQRMTLDCAPTNIPDLVAQCITFVQERATAGGICVATEIAPDFPPLDLDETRFKQILLNLLSNSVKFTRPGGSVTLTARIAPEGPEFQVIDTGIGMTEDEVAIALTPFRQVDSALSRRDQGTGLGLPLAAALIERHGGALAIESMPGVGTTATIRLPRERVLTTGLDGREAAMR
jgi:signal transduction histidine kinase